MAFLTVADLLRTAEARRVLLYLGMALGIVSAWGAIRADQEIWVLFLWATLAFAIPVFLGWAFRLLQGPACTSAG